MEKLENIISTYQQIIQESEQALQRARKRIYYISLLRLVLFVEAIAAAFIFWSDGWLSLFVFAILPFSLMGGYVSLLSLSYLLSYSSGW